MAARTLYVSRPLLNAAELRQWAGHAGFPVALAEDEMHVTVAYSRAPVEWGAPPFVPSPTGLEVDLHEAEGVALKPLGQAVVLRFTSVLLTDRWREFRRGGASWDYETYQPHVTLTYRPPPGRDPADIPPYRGVLKFGPERFKELNPDWKDGVKEAPTGAARALVLARPAS